MKLTFAKKIILIRKSAIFLFVFLYILAMLRPVAPFVEYAINKDYIAKFLCVNKDKPVMRCNGKCHLYKEVKKQQEETPKSLEISLKEYPIGFVKLIDFSTKKHYTKRAKSSFFYKKNSSRLYTDSLFRPPIA